MWRLWECSYLWCTWQMLFGLHCTFGHLRGQSQKEAKKKKKRREKGIRKQNDERMNVAKFQAYYCSHFCLYFALGNSKGWSYSVRNVAALHCGDLALPAPGDNRHPGHGELNPLEFVLIACELKVPNLLPWSVLWILTRMRAELGSRVCLHICMLHLFYWPPQTWFPALNTQRGHYSGNVQSELKGGCKTSSKEGKMRKN